MIAQETIDAVRRIPILWVVGARFALERRGLKHVARCPFHAGTDASFQVDPAHNFFYCFGCRASGNVISFVQQIEGVTFPEAVTRLAQRAGIAVLPALPARHLRLVRPDPSHMTTIPNLTDDGSDPLRAAIALAVYPVFHTYQHVVRDKHPEATFGTGLCWGGAERVFAYQRIRWEGMTEDLIFGVAVVSVAGALSIRVDITGEESGRVHFEVPPLPIPEDASPMKVAWFAGRLAVSFSQLSAIYLDL